MGEANKRGSFEQRQQLAIEREAVQEAIRKKAEQDRRSAWLAEKARMAAEQDAKSVEARLVDGPRPQKYSEFGLLRPRNSILLTTAVMAVAGISAMNTKGRP